MVLKAQQCEQRDLFIECQNINLKEDYEKEEKIHKLIKNLILWDPEERWTAEQVSEFVEQW